MTVIKIGEITTYHVQILVLVQIVDLEQVLRLETVVLAAFQE